MSNKGKVLYIGYYTTKEMIDSLKVFHNVATTERIKDVSRAFSLSGIGVDILSPLLTRKIKNKLFMMQSVDLKFARLITVGKKHKGITGTLIYLFKIYQWLFREIRSYDAVIIYNFNVPFIFMGLLVKCRGIKLILDWEDWSRVRIRDLFNSAESKFLFQLYMSFSQNVMIALSDGIFGPKNFKNIKKHKTVTGILFKTFQVKIRKKPTTEILISGKLTKEHGIYTLYDLLERFSFELRQLGVCFIVAGYGGEDAEFLKKYDIVKFLGFVSEKKYNKLVTANLFALVFQDPNGRFKGEKVPSKLYRYLDNSMRVLSSKFDGDFIDELKNLVDFYDTTEELYELISNYCGLPDNNISCEAKTQRLRFDAHEVGNILKQVVYV